MRTLFLFAAVFLFTFQSRAQGHLLLTEVGISPNGNEFIEIYNPTASAISLTKYYLSDNPDYYKIPAGTQTTNTSDFIVHFPPATSINAGEVIVVAISG